MPQHPHRSPLASISALLLLAALHAAADKPPVPALVGQPWQVAGDPDLGDLTTARQQPVDFAVWQAADGKWQLWSCIRSTKEPGKTRLFYRWESPGDDITAKDWAPRGVAMQADPKLGETQGGLQAPHVVKLGNAFRMLYGDWEHICLATSDDGKTFARHRGDGGKPQLFTQGAGTNTRDPMALRIGDTWHCYYTAYPDRKGAVYCRTSKDLLTWSEAKTVAYGGQAGTNPYSAECPFVVERSPGQFYLFRTQRYGSNAVTRVYHSTDPLDFGVQRDEKDPAPADQRLVASLPVAAPEVVRVGEQWYMAYLLPSLKGIQVSRLEWR